MLEVVASHYPGSPAEVEQGARRPFPDFFLFLSRIAARKWSLA
jgi:hypothetical protein